MLLNQIFQGIFETSQSASIPTAKFLLCILCSILIGFGIAFAYCYKTKYTKSFVLTLALLPAIVCMVILMVNGNLGAGVAVAGTFSLVRFRSVPGTAKEIGFIFLSMGAGLAAGMGFLAYAAIFTLIICLLGLLYTKSRFGEQKPTERILKITIPEDLNYTEVFNDLFDSYTTNHELLVVKTANLGSLFKLHYDITLKNAEDEKTFLDELRCRNGNLEIISARQSSIPTEL